MSVVFSSSKTIYPPCRFSTASFDIVQYYTVTAETAHNPVKVALQAVNEIGYADLLWLANGIRNPFQELYEGRILAIPSIQSASSMTRPAVVAATAIRVRNAKIQGQKIIY